MIFTEALAEWLGGQRWFAGKGQWLHDLSIVSDTQLVSGDPELRHLIVAVSHGTAVDYYQIFVGLRRRLPARLMHASITQAADEPADGGPPGSGAIAYDALHDADLTRHLLAAIAADEGVGSLQMHRVEGTTFQADLDSLVLTAEQSNTSLVYGEESILKVFRRISPGPNPDLEISTALARLGSSQVAEPFGWIETRLEGVPTHLAILSRYLRLATDGWSLAATSVRDLYAMTEADGTGAGTGTGTGAGMGAGTGAGVSAADAGGDFAGESHRLGAATAQVHADLAAAFGTDELRGEAVGELVERMFRKLDQTVSAVPELAKHADMISEAYAELARLPGRFPVQRIHGDYHLGQVLRTETGWVVLDFEGEPATPLAQRRARDWALRDVAGMLRSFDYAARHQLVDHPDAAALSEVARDWVGRNAAAFCAGYAEAGGQDPAANHVLLRALQLDKAVYEVLYEARHRPSWLPIPLDSLAEF
jgi:maltokinase